MVRGVIGRPGGKTRLRKHILPKIPPHTTYVEPFFGGGAVLFGKERSQKEVVNDKDELVYTIHKGVQDTPHCCVMTPDREEWRRIFTKKEAGGSLDVCEQVYLIKNSFGQLGISYSAVKNPKERRVCFNEQHNRLQDVVVLNKDAHEIIKEHDSPDTFFYVDPPYVDVCLYGTRKMGNPLCDITPEKLAKTLGKIEGKFLLSYNNHPRVRSAFDKYHITEVPMRYTGGKGRVGKTWEDAKELLISNYPVERW